MNDVSLATVFITFIYETWKRSCSRSYTNLSRVDHLSPVLLSSSVRFCLLSKAPLCHLSSHLLLPSHCSVSCYHQYLSSAFDTVLYSVPLHCRKTVRGEDKWGTTKSPDRRCVRVGLSHSAPVFDLTLNTPSAQPQGSWE